MSKPALPVKDSSARCFSSSLMLSLSSQSWWCLPSFQNGSALAFHTSSLLMRLRIRSAAFEL
ncbi:hypothetical protein KKH18_07020 [bacterium]|nr:hypothetical protein [bacterium]